MDIIIILFCRKNINKILIIMLKIIVLFKFRLLIQIFIRLPHSKCFVCQRGRREWGLLLFRYSMNWKMLRNTIYYVFLFLTHENWFGWSYKLKFFFYKMLLTSIIALFKVLLTFNNFIKINCINIWISSMNLILNYNKYLLITFNVLNR